jgi:threonine/homoserine/homoserine lactone efflux protein
MSPEFLLTALAVVLTLGTGVVYTLATGLGQGRRLFAASFAGHGCKLALERP